MIDLLKLLDENASSEKLGASSQGRETFFSTILRLIGVTQNVNYTADQEKGTSVDQSKSKDPNLLDNFFKIKTKANEVQLNEVNKLLVTYKKRLLRYSKARQSIKLNRIKKLVDAPTTPLDSTKLVKDTPELTRKNVAQEQAKLISSRDFKGIIDQETSLNRALELSVSQVAQIPESTGDFRNQLTQFLRATATEADESIEVLSLYKQEIQIEVNKLTKEEKLLFSGIDDPSGSQQKLSLINVLDLLIFLTDTKKMKYDCSQCRFFKEGKTSACIYAGDGAISLTRPVTIVDKQTGQTVSGHLSRPTDSCKQIWNLDKNDYYEPSDSVVDFLKNLLKG
jgi:hypothetical protein